MNQAKFSLTPEHLRLLGDYKAWGFKDKSEMVRMALNELEQRLLRQSLTASAEIYAEVNQDEPDLQALTEMASQAWPQ